MKVRRTFGVFIALLSGCGLGIITTHSPIYYRLLYLILILLVFSFLFAFFSAKGFHVKRTSRVLRQQVGQAFVEQFEITNLLSIPRLWLEVSDECTMRGKTGSAVISWIGPKKNRIYKTYSQLYWRGQYTLGPTLLRSGDPLGLFSFSSRHFSDQVLTVFPYTEKLERFPSSEEVLTEGRAVGRWTNDITPRAAGVREYVTGDSLSRVHWASTAKRNQLMVKEFEQDLRTDVWIFLDCSKNIHSLIHENKDFQVEDPWWSLLASHHAKLPQDSFEYAASIAGSISNYYIDRGRLVGLIGSSKINIALVAEGGTRQQIRILENLSLMQPDGKVSLPVLVQLQTQRLLRGSTVILITTTACQNIDVAVDYLIQRRLKPVIILLNSHSFGDRYDFDGMDVRLQQRGARVIKINANDSIKDCLEGSYHLDSGNERFFGKRW